MLMDPRPVVTLTMRRSWYFDALRRGRNTSVITATPKTFVSKTVRKLERVLRSGGPVDIPALLIKMSSDPYFPLNKRSRSQYIGSSGFRE